MTAAALLRLGLHLVVALDGERVTGGGDLDAVFVHTGSSLEIINDKALCALSGHEERHLREARELIVERRLSA